jgi:hypothetical protein
VSIVVNSISLMAQSKNGGDIGGHDTPPAGEGGTDVPPDNIPF